MWQEPRQRHHFKLHYCEQDNHYHLIIGLENISWPFWSLKSALTMVEFSRGIFTEDFAKGNIPAEELAFGDNELHLIEEQIHTRASIHQVGPRGRPLPGFLMPRLTMLHEANVALHWRAFLTHEIPYMAYVHQGLDGNYLKPLYCDFIQRSRPRPKTATPSEWEELAEEPVTRITMEELGIQLDPI